MKVRLYRGPGNGKVYQAPDDQYEIIFAKVRSFKEVWGADPNHLITGPMYNNHRYVRTKHTHPDGSVFFEWDRPRGG